MSRWQRCQVTGHLVYIDVLRRRSTPIVDIRHKEGRSPGIRRTATLIGRVGGRLLRLIHTEIPRFRYESS